MSDATHQRFMQFGFLAFPSLLLTGLTVPVFGIKYAKWLHLAVTTDHRLRDVLTIIYYYSGDSKFLDNYTKMPNVFQRYLLVLNTCNQDRNG